MSLHRFVPVVCRPSIGIRGGAVCHIRASSMDRVNSSGGWPARPPVAAWLRWARPGNVHETAIIGEKVANYQRKSPPTASKSTSQSSQQPRIIHYWPINDGDEHNVIAAFLLRHVGDASSPSRSEIGGQGWPRCD